MRSQRQRMLCAVADAVAVTGYGQLRVKDINQRAGVSRRTFYEHFADREACFLAAYDEASELLLGAVTDAYCSRDAWPEQVHSGLTTLLTVLAAQPATARLCIVEVLAAGDAALRRRAAVLKRLAFLLEPGRQLAGVPTPMLLCDAVVGGIESVVHRYIATGRTRELPDLHAELAVVALVPFLGPGVAARSVAATSPVPARSTGPNRWFHRAEAVDDDVLLLGHHLRRRILEELGADVASTRSLAVRLGVRKQLVDHHLGPMTDASLVEIAAVREERGVTVRDVRATAAGRDALRRARAPHD